MLELFVTFFKLGLFTIGGGRYDSHPPNIMVKDKKWFIRWDDRYHRYLSGVTRCYRHKHGNLWDSRNEDWLDPLLQHSVWYSLVCDNRYYSKGMNFIDGNHTSKERSEALGLRRLGLLLLLYIGLLVGVIKDAFSAIAYYLIPLQFPR